MTLRILVVDNYDSFVYNLVQFLAQLGAETVVRRNDEVLPTDIDGIDGVLTSPGPSTPESAGVSVPIVHDCAERELPLLGVCLGHQAIVEAFGGEVGQAKRLVHGKAGAVSHDGRGLFQGLPDPFEGGRYHSLAATRIPDVLEVCATTADGEVMAVRHRELPIDGIQFHPESVLTPTGPELALNFLEGRR